MTDRRTDDTLLFRAGKGEWYNQPHDRRWDMGEDVAEIPPAGWHLDLERAMDQQEKPPKRVRIDASEFDWLVGQDLGFLLRFEKQFRARGTKIEVVTSSRVAAAIKCLNIHERLAILEADEHDSDAVSD